MTRLFPWAVVALEGCAGIVYLIVFLHGREPKHGWLALTWIMYALAAIGLAKVG